MKQKSYKTKPFAYTYKVYDKFNGVCIFESTDLVEAFDILHEHRHDTVVVSVYNRYAYEYEPGHPMHSWEERVPRYELWNHFGKEVPYSKYEEAYRKRYPRYRHRGWGGYWDGHGNKKDDTVVRYEKNNTDKIKQGYFHAYTYDNSFQPDYVDWRIGGCYRNIASTNERRQTCGHVAEHGDNITRGRRRGTNLPNAWDDEARNTSWDTASSWKHNSRRRHQWKVKRA
jgi:hypothetical protein